MWLLSIVSLMNLLWVILFILFLLRPLLFLFINRRPIWYPILLLLHLTLFNILLHYTIILSVQSFQIKYVKYVINLIVIDICMLLKTFKLKVYIKSLLTTYITKWLLVLFYLLRLLTKLWKFVDNCTWKNLEYYHLSKYYIKYFT